jgi:hypothetical protein
MIGMNFNPPPVEHDRATSLAQVYLAAAIDPAATRARLDELDAATKGLRDAIALNETTAAKAAEVEVAQSALAAREQALADRESTLSASQTRLSVSAGAIADRDQAVKSKEDASDRRQAELDKREADFAQKIATYRAALA